MSDPWQSPTVRAAIGTIIGGPVGVVTALATGGPLVLLTGLFVAAGGLIGALTSDEHEPREAAIDAMLPVGAWLMGAAVGWVLLSTMHEDLPQVVQAHPAESALAAGVIGGTIAVVVLVVRLAKTDGKPAP